MSSTLDLEALFRDAAGDVYAYARTLLRDDGGAEDVTAQAFERAHRRRQRYNAGKGSPRAWLFAIARNAALDELRRRSRTAALTTDLPDDASGLEDDTDDAVRRAAVRAALADLEPRERELIALKFHGGLTNAELARALGMSQSNAGTRVHRAVTKLREACHAPA